MVPVLIDKLQTDTRQRVVLYDALSKSLKTSRQQDVAHRTSEIGVRTDQEAQTAMAGIGAATNARMADALGAHEGQTVFSRDVWEAKARADERFMRFAGRSGISTRIWRTSRVRTSGSPGRRSPSRRP